MHKDLSSLSGVHTLGKATESESLQVESQMASRQELFYYPQKTRINDT